MQTILRRDKLFFFFQRRIQPSKDIFEDFETRHSLVKDVEATTKARLLEIL